jgi:hypothetical protein
MQLFLCWPEGVANEGTKVIGIVAEHEEQHIGVMLPLAKVKIRNLRFFRHQNSEAEIMFLLEVVGRVVREASLQHFMCRHKLASWLILRLEAPIRLHRTCFCHHHWKNGSKAKDHYSGHRGWAYPENWTCPSSVGKD